MKPKLIGSAMNPSSDLPSEAKGSASSLTSDSSRFDNSSSKYSICVIYLTCLKIKILLRAKRERRRLFEFDDRKGEASMEEIECDLDGSMKSS